MTFRLFPWTVAFPASIPSTTSKEITVPWHYRQKIISHWAGYFNVNPILLIHVLKAISSKAELRADSIRTLASSLGTLTLRGKTARREWSTSQDLAAELRSIFSLSANDSSSVIDLTRKETEAVQKNYPSYSPRLSVRALNHWSIEYLSFPAGASRRNTMSARRVKVCPSISKRGCCRA